MPKKNVSRLTKAQQARWDAFRQEFQQARAAQPEPHAADLERLRELFRLALTGQRTPPAAHVFGSGDWEPEKNADQRRVVRRLLLDLVQQGVPAVLCTLFTNVLPAYEQLALPTFDSRIRPEWELREPDLNEATGALPELHAWARHWYLDVPWAKRRTLDTLTRWNWRRQFDPPTAQFDPPPGESGRKRLAGMSWAEYYAGYVGWAHEPESWPAPIAMVEQRFDLDETGYYLRGGQYYPTDGSGAESRSGGYHPWWESRQQAYRRMRSTRAREEALTTHLDATEKQMRAADWAEKPQKRTEEDVLWTVQYQVCRMRYAAIARRFHRDRAHVTQAIGAICTLIELPLRPKNTH